MASERPMSDDEREALIASVRASIERNVRRLQRARRHLENLQRLHEARFGPLRRRSSR